MSHLPWLTSLLGRNMLSVWWIGVSHWRPGSIRHKLESFSTSTAKWGSSTRSEVNGRSAWKLSGTACEQMLCREAVQMQQYQQHRTEPETTGMTSQGLTVPSVLTLKSPVCSWRCFSSIHTTDHSPLIQTSNVPGLDFYPVVGYWLDTPDRVIERKRPNMEARCLMNWGQPLKTLRTGKWPKMTSRRMCVSIFQVEHQCSLKL